MRTAEELLERARVAATAYHRLILLVGSPGSGKTALLRAAAGQGGWPVLNLSLELAKRLKELPARSRSRKMTEYAEDAVGATEADVVAVDHIELAFEPDLEQDPLRLLQHLSRIRTIVAAWPGTYEREQLTYAEPSHREYRTYSRPNVQVVSLHEPSAKHEPKHDLST